MAAILIEEVSKAYRLGTTNQRAFFKELWGKLSGHPVELFWALRDVSFQVNEGEVVGILGHNGAGKSTLLKILSQITRPTKGQIRLRGRVASLLEIGTGFHPELTGRENVFLNGAILGMKRREIASKFDEILAFSQLDEFIETPVKRYSTGMRVRLAFAVAAHLEPEILVVDEVLAVGDASFQQRCVGKIGEVSRSGRTVLFVSHNAAAVESLCSRCVVLDHGVLRFDGTQGEALRFYAERYQQGDGRVPIGARQDRGGSGEVRASSLELRDESGRPLKMLRSGEGLEMRIGYASTDGKKVGRLSCDVTLSNALGTAMVTFSNTYTSDPMTDLPPAGTLSLKVKSLPLAEGPYKLQVMMYALHRKRGLLDDVHDAAEVTVLQSDYFGRGKVPSTTLGDGPFLVNGDWSLEA